ncbi:helix-turn-helix domain-containing protein [Pelagicoccus mobilis]|uniref:Helix-turn-helix transcriptional regulator n=1 Tax=Pelagicoccus mobilis TaxID=415221 RepID=A0A934S6U8_9BACT|nr:AraC family transcriptional regulator [Pelagicoccus mobilis]MBK1880449.1 helix-turn-helix transcriptional regulator [Pelagicoccus mobilis]
MDFQLHAFGIHERMPTGLQHYSSGIKEWLFIFFHDEAQIGTAEGSVHVSPNSFVVWEPKTEQIYGSRIVEWDHSWLHVQGTAIPTFLEENNLSPRTPIPYQQSSIADALMHRLYQEETKWSVPDSRIQKNHVENALIDIARASTSKQEIDPRLQRVKRAIDSQPQLTPTLQELADIAKLSVPHLCAQFKKAFGQAPVAYLTHSKIERAKHLLSTRKDSISEISDALGYSDPFHFSRMFKRKIGLSPRQWRSEQTTQG